MKGIFIQVQYIPHFQRAVINCKTDIINTKLCTKQLNLENPFKEVCFPAFDIHFNKILDLGHFPEVWSEGYVVPIHKKGKLDDVNNLRGITLLSSLCKLFTRVLTNRLTTWAEEYYIYIEAQTGFRANMSTADNVFVLRGIINDMLNSNKKCFVRL